jgi:peptidoglycan-associated lipoprotein
MPVCSADRVTYNRLVQVFRVPHRNPIQSRKLKMPNRKSCLIALLAFGLVLFVGGCKKSDVETVPEAPAPAPEPEPVVEEAAPVEVTEETFEEPPVPFEEPKPTIAELNAQGVLATVYFDFDKSDLTDETRVLLRQNADWLKANSEYAVVIEGHCDERGTIEYNLALGQRRAQSVQDYLVNLGIPADRMRNKSFGEEQPADPGHDEAAWSRNRRAAFVIE